AAVFTGMVVVVTSLAMSPASADGPTPDPATARLEVDFLGDMIDHHAMAVDMAEMCEDKAAHDELRSMCEEIATAQSAEIVAMQSWLQDWYGVSHAPSMPAGQMRRMEGMAELDPAAFEVEFMETMVRHHRQAVREAGQCVNRAGHADLVDLCENIIETQTHEIELMQGWLCDWYDRCGG
ncbi:MAG: DUF305 domain-containing protein, partial [Acidimicrobiia bacterium]